MTFSKDKKRPALVSGDQVSGLDVKFCTHNVAYFCTMKSLVSTRAMMVSMRLMNSRCVCGDAAIFARAKVAARRVFAVDMRETASLRGPNAI